MLELSSLTRNFEVPSNRLYLRRDTFVRKGEKIIDLVSGNVNSHGIHFPEDILKRAFTKALQKTKIYQPDPLGQIEARESISRYYAEEGLHVPASQIVVTPGTSFSYWYAFKVLANPGDEILAPAPSYPLFDSIAQLSGVKLVSYRMHERSRWEIDFDQMESAITARTKAIILISPHNPTGAVATSDEVQRLSALASRKGLPIIADEVFSSFLFNLSRLPRPAHHAAPLVITLNGFSKMLALPGLKIGWMALTGGSSLVRKALTALEMISDTFLPVNEVAQALVRPLLRESKSFQSSYRSEIGLRLELATDLIMKGMNASFIRPEGGFFLSLSIQKRGVEEEALACRLLEMKRILVHPGYFYDMEGSHIVLSFVSRPRVLRNAFNAVIEEIR